MPSEARDKARYLLDHGADFIKLIATGAVLAIGSEPGALELSPEEMKAACDEAKLRGSYCIAHAHGAEGIKAAIRAGARTIEHASYLDAEGIALAKKHGVWLDMDIYNGDWIEEVGTKEGWPAEYLRKNRETTDVQRRGFAAAVKAGAKLTFGTDAAVYPYGLGGAAVRLHGPLRNDARCRRSSRRRPRRHEALRQGRRSRDAPPRRLGRFGCRPRRSARRHQCARTRRSRDQGRRGRPVASARPGSRIAAFEKAAVSTIMAVVRHLPRSPWQSIFGTGAIDWGLR